MPPSASRNGTLLGLLGIVLVILFGLPTPDSFASIKAQSKPEKTWLSKDILCVRCNAEGLGARLVDLCKAIERQCKGRSVSNRGGWQSKDLTSLGEFSELMQLVAEPAKVFLETQGWTYPTEDGEELEIAFMPDQLWANINRPGDWNARHTHGSPGGSLFASGVFYPEVLDASPSRLLLFPSSNKSGIDVVPESNLLVLFPPDVPHEVEPAAADAEERISIAFNLVVRWLPGELLQAAYIGDSAKVKSMAADTADRLLGLTAAHVAAEQGHLAVLQALTESKVSLSADSSLGTPLERAAAQGHELVVDYLMSETQPGLNALRSALTAAAERGHGKVVERVRVAVPNYFKQVAAAALPSAAVAGHAEILQQLLEGSEGSAGTPEAKKAMMEAATRGHSEVVEILLAAGVDAESADSSGKTALHNAAASGHVDVVRNLARSTSGRASLHARDKQDAEPLHWAALQGHAAVVEELAAAGADVDSVALGSVPGRPLNWAVRGGNADVVQSLLQLGADVGTPAVRDSIPPLPPGKVLVRSGDVLVCTHQAEVPA